MSNEFISLYDGSATVTSGGRVGIANSAPVATDYTMTVGTGVQTYWPWQPQPVPWSPYQTWVNWPVMHPHACPICEGRETMPAGFYRDVAEDKGPQQCRACKGKGLVYLP